MIALLKSRNYDVMDGDEEYKYLRGMRIEQVEEENVAKLLKEKDEKMTWIMKRLSEPSSWGALGVGVIAIGTITGIGELVFVGLGCAILGLILSEEAKK